MSKEVDDGFDDLDRKASPGSVGEEKGASRTRVYMGFFLRRSMPKTRF